MTNALPTAVLAEAHDYVDILMAMRLRAKQLEVSRECLDEAAGIPDGYSSKALAGLKNFGAVTLGPALGALGLKLLVVEDEAMAARVAKLPKCDSAKRQCKSAALRTRCEQTLRDRTKKKL